MCKKIQVNINSALFQRKSEKYCQIHDNRKQVSAGETVKVINQVDLNSMKTKAKLKQ